jgi:hypothetical protein
MHEGTAAGRQHLWPTFQQPGDHTRLAGAEIRLTVLGKDIADAHSRRLLDFNVGIGEGQAEPLRQLAPNGGFAGAHHADQHQRPIAKGSNHPGIRFGCAMILIHRSYMSESGLEIAAMVA